MKSVVSAYNLVVHRGQTFRLQLDRLRLGQGTILCVAGPNGSGKTTLVECLAGLLVPDTGYVSVCNTPLDHNLAAVRSPIGYVPDNEQWFVKELCAQEYFNLLITVYRSAGVQLDMPTRLQQLATTLSFTNFLQPLFQLSHGNKKKVQLIAGLLHQPKLLIVDELRNGLDPLAVIAAEQLLRNEAGHGTCIVAATHDLWWAERFAQQILLLVNGKPVVYAPTNRIVARYGSIEKLFVQKVCPERAT